MDNERYDLDILSVKLENRVFRYRHKKTSSYSEDVFDNLYQNANLQAPALNPVSCGSAVLTGGKESDFRQKASPLVYWNLMLITEGEGIFISGKSIHHVRKGDIILPSPCIHCTLKPVPGKSVSRSFVVFGNGHVASAFCSERIIGKLPLIQHPASPEPARLMEKILEAAKENKNSAAFEISKLTYALLLEIIAFQKRKHCDIRNKVFAAMECTVYKPYNIDEMAAACDMTRRTFNRFFRKTFQMTPVEYIRNLRMYYAASFLIGNRMSIKEIAEHFSYCNLSYFSRDFKKIFGCTPREYRNRKFSE